MRIRSSCDRRHGDLTLCRRSGIRRPTTRKASSWLPEREGLSLWLFRVGAGFDVGLEALDDKVRADSVEKLSRFLIDLACDIHGDAKLRAYGIGQKFVGGDAVDCPFLRNREGR